MILLTVATLLLGDYPGLKTVAYNYQYDPMVTRNFSKRHPVDFSSLRLCMVECISSDPEFHEILADRWLRPLGNLRAREIVAPMLCLPEHGGMVVVMRDWLGGEDHMMPLWDGNPDDIDRKELKELLLDKEALKTNDVVVIAQVRKPINYVDCRAKKRDAEQMSRELLELEALDTQLPMLHLPLSILKQA